MPRKCDMCGSFKLRCKSNEHIFKQKNGSFSQRRTEDSIEHRITVTWECKNCSFTGQSLIRPFKLVNGKYVIDDLGNVS